MTRAVDEAVSALEAGRMILLPTETVYGLGADAGNPAAVAAIFQAKGRPRFNPLISHVADASAAARIGVFDRRAQSLAEAFWPGPMTLVVPVGDATAVCDLARAGLDSVGLRVPGHPVAREVLAAFGKPVVAPSANRSGRPSPTTLADAEGETGAAAAVALDGGACRVGIESTVVAVLDGTVRLLRPGVVTRSEIEAIVGPLDADAEGHRSPGRLTRHYAPDAPLRLDAQTARDGEILLGFGPGVGDPAFSLSETADLREAASRVFTLLRQADLRSPKAIAVSPIPSEGLGEAINDRLRRAAGYVG